MKNKSITSIESLEQRIAPAAVTINAALHTATWTDFDGDLVTLKYSSAQAPTFATTDNGAGLIVDKITLTAADHSNAAFTLSVTAAGGGDGHIDLGRIDATGVPLKSWRSPSASIAEFDCGDNVKAIGTFVSGTFGAIPFSKFNNTGGEGNSYFLGAVNNFTVKGDIAAAEVVIGTPTAFAKHVTVHGNLNGATGGLVTSGQLGVYSSPDGSVTVDGDIVGGPASGDGNLALKSPVAKVVVKGSLIGGTGKNSGGLSVEKTAKSVLIGGDIVGGSAGNSGRVLGGVIIDTLKVAGSVLGGSGVDSGSIAGGVVHSLAIGGNLVGGTETGSGVCTLQYADTIAINGSIIGGQGTSATLTYAIGGIYSQLGMKTLTIGGDLVGGTYRSGEHHGFNGFVATDYGIGKLAIKGDILGHDGEQAIIIAEGTDSGATGYAAIGKLIVGGSVNYAYIAAGQFININSFEDRIGAAENPDAHIGSVTVGGNWFHSNLSAGINDINTTGLSNTDTRDAGVAELHATIGPILIKGHILDNPAALGFSGFLAEKIASITAGGVKLFKSGDPARSVDSFGFVDIAEI